MYTQSKPFSKTMSNGDNQYKRKHIINMIHLQLVCISYKLRSSRDLHVMFGSYDKFPVAVCIIIRLYLPSLVHNRDCMTSRLTHVEENESQ